MNSQVEFTFEVDYFGVSERKIVFLTKPDGGKI